MSAAVGALAVRIAGDARQLVSELDRSSRRSKSFGQQIQRTAKRVAAFAAGAAAAGAAITAHLVNTKRKAIDEASKLARQLDTTTKSVQVLQRAGELGGVDNMNANLERLNRRLSDADRGLGSAGNSLDMLRLSTEELISLPMDDRLALIGQRMNEYVPAAQHASIANELFGRSGMEMLEVLRDADGTIGRAQREMETFGNTVSDIEARQIEQANDAISGMRLLLDGVITQLTVQLAPILKGIAQLFNETAAEAGGMSSVVSTGMASAAKAVGHVADALRGLHVLFKLLQGVGHSFNAVMSRIMSEIAAAIERVINAASGRIRSLADLANRIPGIEIDTSALDQADGAFARATESLNEMSESAKAAAKEAFGEAHDLAMRELPSDQIARLIEQWKEDSLEAAEVAERIRDQFRGLSIEGDDEEAARRQQQMSDRLERLRESLLTEREAEEEHHNERMQMIEDALEHELMTEEEINQLKEREQQRHADKMMDIMGGMTKGMADESARHAEREKNERMRHMQDMQRGVSSTLGQMTKDNEAFGIAQAIVNTWRGVSESLAAYPWPVSAAMAASSLAAGMQAVRNIKSGSQAGGGSGASGGGAIPSSGGGAQTASGASGGGGNRGTAVVNITGDVFDRETTLRVARQISELERDGYDVMVPAT